MSTTFIISVIVNFGLIMLVLSLVYPRLIARHRRKKKQAEIQEATRIQRIVHEYLKELQRD